MDSWVKEEGLVVQVDDDDDENPQSPVPYSPPSMMTFDVDDDDDDDDDTDDEPQEIVASMNNYNDNNEDDDNIIVREIDVFLSPELFNKLHLIQFPLQREPFSSSRSTRMTHNNQSDQQPQVARIKPQHCMVELEYTTTTDGHQDYHGQFALSKRTFTSQTIPVSTHMALGKMVGSKSSLSGRGGGGSGGDGMVAPGLHLVPLQRITQMRPSFHHVNEATMHLSSNSGDEMDTTAGSSSAQDNAASRRPLPFQKKESERAALARKSSYAYKKMSEDSEGWITLEVYGEDSIEAEEIMEQVHCTAPFNPLLLPATGTGQIDTSSMGHVASNPDVTLQSQHSQQPQQQQEASGGPPSSLSPYVQSLNYLPQTDFGSSKTSAWTDESGATQDLVMTTVTKMVELMHQGWPMPYSVLRAQFDRQMYTDEILLQALSSCAFLVRGNFILQSRLLPLPTAVGQARTFLLLMLQSVGVVHRPRLEYTYQGDDQVTPEVLLMLLEQVATRTTSGWKPKIDDDLVFESNFPDAVSVHLAFWKKQVRRFSGMVERYRNIPPEHDN